MSFRLYSTGFKDGERLPLPQVQDRSGYDGQNLSPALAWEGVPEGTKSLALTCYDPDAPTGSGWWHWVVVNIPVDTTALEEGAGSDMADLPSGVVQCRNDAGFSGYVGAAPPKGPPHRYIFTLYALKTDRLNVTPDSSGAAAGFQIHANSLASTRLTALFGI